MCENISYAYLEPYSNNTRILNQIAIVTNLLSFLSGKKINVSIILPVYNAEKFLPRCLDALARQTFRQYEVIAVNDCSTDNSLNILNDYKENIPCMTVIDNNINMGAGKARNTALKLAKGKYVAFIDSDDWISNNYLELLYMDAENVCADIAFSNLTIVDRGAKYKYKHFYQAQNRFTNSNYAPGDLANEWRSTAPWMKLFRKKFIIDNGFRFMEGIRLGAEDIPFTWLAYLYAKNISFNENAFYYYHLVPESLDRAINQNILEIFDALDFTSKELNRIDPNNPYRTNLDTLYVSHIYYQFKKIKRIDNQWDRTLVTEYWNKAHACLNDIPLSNVIGNKFLSEPAIQFYQDATKHSVLNADLLNRYFEST